MNIWSREQFEHFITFEENRIYRIAFNILFYSGIREGELLALTPEDVPEDAAELRISKNFERADGIDYFLEPKTSRSNRTVSIHESLHKEILELIHDIGAEKDERIFYFKKNGLLKEFYRVTKRAALEQIKIHDLRHSHVSMLINMLIPITEISARLGHENPEITLKTYSHLYPGTERNVVDKITALFETSDSSVDIMDEY